MSMNADYSEIHIETTLPKPWEEEASFNDILYDWMSRAPWLVISAVAHLLVFFILAAVPWHVIFKKTPPAMQAQLEVPPEDPFEEPEEEPEEEIEEEPIEEPVLKDAEISDHNETEDDMETDMSEGDPDFNSDSPFDETAFNDVIGIGGGAGGKFGGRFGGKRNLRAAGGSGTEQALKDGLEWLKNHQSEDGSWESENYSANCGKIGANTCEGAGSPLHDVGITGLALLAFLGDGHTTDRGQYKDVVREGVFWLREQQDPDTGLIGDRASHEFLYNHAIATLALCEAYYFSKSPTLRRICQEAVNYIQRARNPYNAWRYEVPPNGESDSSVTGWMVFALASARDGGLKVDPEAFTGAMSFLDEVTDTASGRVGYTEVGQASSRIDAVNEHFPRERAETLTAVGLLTRIFLEQDPKDVPVMNKHADLLLQKLPVWDTDGLGNDMYYWYYGTYAMFQMSVHSDKYWKKWNNEMKPAILDNQRKTGDEKGSWDPSGPWGHAGGRVYSTALMVLCLEVYFRYGKVLGAR